MKITILELRSVIRNVIRECYGWPVEKEQSLYGVPNKMGSTSPRDPKNKSLKLPKGPNSRGGMNESFQRISSKELNAWSQGNYDQLTESDETQDPCDKCGAMFASSQLMKVENEHLCNQCRP